MKNLKLKLVLAVVGIALYSSNLLAQANPVTITNTTNCPVFIEYVEALDCSTGTNCYSVPTPNCIPPMTRVTVAPCGPPSFQWSSVGITSADFACNPCSFLQVVNSSFMCNPPPYTIALPICSGCGPVQVTFNAPDEIVIY
jgi:hypothetical protein